MTLRIGSRGSKLAVTQSHWIADQLKKNIPGIEITFKEIVTTGDRDQSPSFQTAGGKGVFVKEIEEALLANEIDLAVHSLKDVPGNFPHGLILGPIPQREDPRDAVISRFGEMLSELPRGSTIGTSSPRRQAQIANLYKKRSYRIEPLRGNVDTRVKKVHEGKVDAIVLAAAGLKRLGLASEITHMMEPEIFLPAATQGCLGLELRENDKLVMSFLEKIKDDVATITGMAERAFLQGLGGNCLVPVGAYSTINGDELHMRGIVIDAEGTKAIRAEEKGPKEQPMLVGYQLAERLLHEGAAELL